MIKIDFVELASTLPEDRIKLIGINAAGKAYADVMRTQHGNKKCEMHPEQTSNITIHADMKKHFTLEKNEFCCEEFKNSLKLLES